MDIYSPNDLIKYFEEHKKPGLDKFHAKLIFTKYNFIGVESKIVHALAKNIAKEGDAEQFLKIDDKNSFEIVMIKGLVIAYSKLTTFKKQESLRRFVGFIDNWAINDSVCSRINVKNDMDTWFKFFESLLTGSTYSIRFGLCGFIKFLDDGHIDKILKWAGSIKSEEYYVRMMQAWLVSDAFIKQRNKTLKFLQDSPLDKFTHNKAIQKIRESFRVSEEDKNMLVSIKK